MTKFEELWEATKSNLRLHPEKGEYELMYTRYHGGSQSIRTEAFVMEHNGELYLYKRSSYYDPASSTHKIINESNYMKMNTVKEAVQTLKCL